MKKLIILYKFIVTNFMVIFLILIANNSYSQTIVSSSNFGATKDDGGRCVVTDNFSNVYLAGTYQDSISDENGNSLNFSNGGSDIFLFKRDSSGNIIWSRSLGGAFNEACYSIVIDSNFNLIMTGTFLGTVDFDPGPSVFTLTADSINFDIFVLKLDSSGAFQFAKKIGGTDQDFGYSITTGSNDCILLTGTYRGVVDFDPDTSVFLLQGINPINYSEFILKLNKYGQFVWAKSISGGGLAYSQSIKIDKFNNIYTAGYFTGNIDFDPDTIFYNLWSYGGEDIFIHKVDSNGNFIWVKRFGSTGKDKCYSIDVDTKGNIALTGVFSGFVDFDPDSLNTHILTSWLAGDAFVVKLDSLGNFSFAKQYSDGACSFNCFAYGHFVRFDRSGNLVIVGFNEVGKYGFIFIYSSTGTTINSNRIDPYFPFSQYVFIWSLALTNEGYLYATGSFKGSIRFRTNPQDTLSSFGGSDIFLAKYLYCSRTYSTINVFGCKTYISPSGLFNWNANGIYKDTILNTKGCDSIITINLTIVVIDTSVTRTGNKLTANQSFSTYQWLNCNNGFSPLLFQTGQNYLPMTSGIYAVEIAKNGCKDTSSCYTVLLTNLQTIDNSSSISIYQSFFDTREYTIELPDEFISNGNLEITLFEINGKIIKNISTNSSGKKRSFIVPEIATGLYLVRVKIGQKIFTKKLMIY